MAFSDDVERWVPPKKGAAHVLRIVRDCLAVPAVGRRTRLAPALEFVSRVVRKKAVVFVVSDFMSSGWSKPLAACARRHDVVAVRLRTPEYAPPPAGLLRTRDPETDDRSVIDWSSERVRQEYTSRVDAWKANTEDALRRANVDLMDVPVPRTRDRESVARPIQRFFRMRERRGAKR